MAEIYTYNASYPTIDRDADFIPGSDTSAGNVVKRFTPQKLMDDVPATTSAAGSMSAASMQKIAKLTTDGNYIGTVQTIGNSDSSPVTLDVTKDEVEITKDNGDVVLVYPASPVGKVWIVIKLNTSSHTISARPMSGGSVNGGSTDADMLLPDSADPMTSSTGLPIWRTKIRTSTSVGVS